MSKLNKKAFNAYDLCEIVGSCDMIPLCCSSGQLTLSAESRPDITYFGGTEVNWSEQVQMSLMHMEHIHPGLYDKWIYYGATDDELLWYGEDDEIIPDSALLYCTYEGRETLGLMLESERKEKPPTRKMIMDEHVGTDDDYWSVYAPRSIDFCVDEDVEKPTKELEEVLIREARGGKRQAHFDHDPSFILSGNGAFVSAWVFIADTEILDDLKRMAEEKRDE